MNEVNKVAVLVPVYNVAEYLPRCLDSILAQTYRDLQVIVVDDGSTDDSGAIADTYAARDARVQVIHQSHRGVAAARNAALSQVTTLYLTFIDADDYVAPTYVTTLLNILQTYQTPLAMVGLRRLDEKGRAYTRDQHGQMALCTKTVLSTMIDGDDPLTIAVYAKLFTTALFSNVHFPVGHTSEDVAVMYQLVAQCPRIAVDLTPQYYHCFRRQSVSQALTNYSSVVADDLTYHRQFIAQVCQDYPELQANCERWLLLIHLSQWLRGRGKTNRAVRKELWQYVKTHRHTILRQKKLTRKETWLLRATYLGSGLFGQLWLWWRKCIKRHNM